MIYDEPTGGLDTITAKEIIELICSIKQKFNTTSIIITHDLVCAKYTSDRIIVLKDGKVNIEGTYQLIEHSKDAWIKSFLKK